jgi:hypothetical protein
MQTIGYKKIKQGGREFAVTITAKGNGMFQVQKMDLDDFAVVYHRNNIGVTQAWKLFNGEKDRP